MRSIILLLGVTVLAGCSTTAGVFFNRPVVEDSVGKTLHTVSLSADRRTVVVKTTDPGRGKFCAEPPPDSATSLASQFDVRASTKSKDGREVGASADDRFKTAD